MQRFLFLFFFCGLVSCSKDVVHESLKKPTPCDSSAFSYRNDIQPIIANNCAFSGCHIPGGAGQYDYRDYAHLADRIRNGRVQERIQLPSDNILHMPQGFNLSECDYFKLKSWIDQGFPEN